MSKLATNICGDALQSLACLFRSDKFNQQDLSNASAMLSQRGVSSDVQTLDSVLKFMLNEWGIGFDEAIKMDSDGNRQWMYDSVTFLTKNPSIIGFLVKHSDNNWRACKRADTIWEWQENKFTWDRIQRHEIIDKLMSYNCPVYLVWKKWIPVQQWVDCKRPFYIRSADTEDNTRWEYEPTSCWMPQKMVYSGKSHKMKKILKKWDSPCLISNAKHFLMLKPSSSGWNTETIMEFDGLPVGTVASRLARLVEDAIYEQIEKNPTLGAEIMPHLAHALMSVASKFEISINHKQISAFEMDADETEKIREYDEQLEKINLSLGTDED
jgi:hypothetical protein